MIWERLEKSTQTGRPALSYERIAQAGVEIADAEGLDAVSMRKVAARLEVGTMSLYRYVESRDELIQLLVDRVYGEAQVPLRTGNWRTDMAGVARLSRQVALRHSWLAGHPTSLDSFGPNMLTMMESILALLDGYGLRPEAMLDLWTTVQAFVQGYVQEEAAQREAVRRTGVTKEQRQRALSPYLHRTTASGRYPLLAATLLAAQDHVDPDAAFERRLGYLLDGLNAAFFPAPAG